VKGSVSKLGSGMEYCMVSEVGSVWVIGVKGHCFVGVTSIWPWHYRVNANPMNLAS